MKRKRTKPARTKEEQAALDGWIYVCAPKTRCGWNQVWVEQARGGLDSGQEKTTK